MIIVITSHLFREVTQPYVCMDSTEKPRIVGGIYVYSCLEALAAGPWLEGEGQELSSALGFESLRDWDKLRLLLL